MRTRSARSGPVAVTYVVTGLDPGGAETTLLRLLGATDRARFSPRVISLTTDGDIGARMRSIGVPVTVLGLRRRSPARPLKSLVSELRDTRPDVVQTWMYHADLFGGLAARAARVPAVAWGIRQGDLLPATTRRSTRAVARTCAMLSSSVPDVIVCCTPQAADVHARVGYDPSRMVVIPNGIDVAERPPGLRLEARQTLDLDDDVLVVTRVGRWHPHKDYPLLFRAFAEVARQDARAVLLVAGPGLEPDAPEPRRLLTESGLHANVRLLGERDDVMRLFAATDVAVSSSTGEGFPNTVAEAMAMGVPVVATDVGATADVVGEGGWLVPPGDPDALASALLTALRAEPEERGRRGGLARERIRASFGLAKMTEAYAALHERLAFGRSAVV